LSLVRKLSFRHLNYYGSNQLNPQLPIINIINSRGQKFTALKK
jgi:hypothetical protein